MRVEEFPDLSEEFSVFSVKNHRARYNEAEFRDLKGFKLSAAEKNFFARQCKGQQAEGEPDIKFGQSDRGFAARYNLSQGVTCLWVANWVNPNAVNNDQGGRPASIDEQGMQDFFKKIKDGKKVPGKSKAKQKKTLYVAAEVTEILNMEYRKSQKRKGHHLDEDDDTIVTSGPASNPLDPHPRSSNSFPIKDTSATYLLAASFISYIGPFNKSYRERLMEETLIPLVSEPPIPGTQPIPMTPDMGMSAYAQRKETAAKQKEIDDARALVDKSKKKVEKTVLAAAEKARVKGLTPEQKLNDPAYILKAAQSKEKKEKAQQLKDAEASKVAAATARVNAAT